MRAGEGKTANMPAILRAKTKVIITFIVEGHQSPIATLNTWASRHQFPIRYMLLDHRFLPTCNSPSMSHPCSTFYYRLYVGQHLYFDGQGLSHQQARIDCARHAINFIDEHEKSFVSSVVSTSSEVMKNYRFLY